MSDLEMGCIVIWIDEIVPCLQAKELLEVYHYEWNET
jgi:hypothetical protein